MLPPIQATQFKYELFFELSPDLLCIAGFDGYFKKINQSVSNLLEYSMEELYSRPINDFVYQEDKDITSRVRTELTKRKPLFNFENRYVTKSGNIVWLSWTSLPVESEQLIFAIAKNITHKKTIDAGRNELVARLSRMNEELKHLTYTTSHDLRSPVNNLMSLFSMIDLSRINDGETRELITYLQSAGIKLKDLLNNYVDLLSAKDVNDAELTQVDLQKTLDTVIYDIASLLATSKTNIKSDFGKATGVYFNSAGLHSVFLNLITNSIKYARPDSLPEISITSEKIPGFTRIVYHDNGIGFDLEKVRGRIFGLHQKFHDHGDSKGIGLYLVYSTLTRSGAQIEVESRVNEGAQFTILIRDQL
jgi:PAS domain S-box-containing protein